MNNDKNLSPLKKMSQSRPNHHLIDIRNQFLSPNKKHNHLHALSENKHRVNVIKINKAKLPPDFFPKCMAIEKKIPSFKLNINENERLMPSDRPRRVQSQRLHNSPQKGSLYGLFEPDPFSPMRASSKTLAIKRNFQTREQPKRDNTELKRRFTPGNNTHRNQLYDIFPISSQNMEIITSISSKKINKLSPRKEYHLKMQQFVHDPQKYDGQNNFQPRSLINLKTIQQCLDNQTIEQNNYVYTQTVDLHNMTFFNVKSTSLPPIRKS